MSFTMTMDMPASAVSFFTRNGTRSGAELGEIFVAFMKDRLGYVAEDGACADEGLAALAGSWVEDPAMDNAFAAMDTIDEELWK